jgi:hypothetical protein
MGPYDRSRPGNGGRPLLDPTYIIFHRITLDEAPEMYQVWRDKQEAVTKIVIDPWAARAA